ncbi:MAG: histidine kinase dimerization/phospho-acceptor domain-containing protein [Pseudonocardiaceae bacterium]
MAAGQARRAESETRQFLSDAAHELRTPLAGIQVIAEQLAGGQSAEADLRQRRRATLLMRETAPSWTVPGCLPPISPCAAPAVPPWRCGPTRYGSPRSCPTSDRT